jgi:UDP-GlcNAc:undecaprenyl-phosphate GlcNAc-1-phosphate transferase
MPQQAAATMNALLLPMGLSALIAALLAIVSVPLVKRLAERAGVIREVRARDSHDRPVPLWGGVAMFAGFFLTVLLLRPLTGHALTVSVGRGEHPILGILLGAAVVSTVGMLDDKYDLKPSYQAGALLFGGFLAALCGARIDGVTNPFAPASGGGGYTSDNYVALGLWSYPLTMVWVFLAAKTFDFLDGLDGLAAGVCAIAATTMGLIAAARGEAAVALMAAALAGSCLGFLRYNYNPASIFMGTVGSYLLGFVLATLAVVGTVKAPTTIAVVIPLLVLGVPVFDAFYVIARRVAQGKRPTQADRTHIHHRLRDRGLSVRQAVWAIYGLTGACCLAALLLVWHWSK